MSAADKPMSPNEKTKSIVFGKRKTMTTEHEFFGLVVAGRIRIEINQPSALKDAAQAHRDLETRKTTGSSIFVI
jgi:NADPH:quinone reductase-like Zn-dependent oxidoreductase